MVVCWYWHGMDFDGGNGKESLYSTIIHPTATTIGGVYREGESVGRGRVRDREGA